MQDFELYIREKHLRIICGFYDCEDIIREITGLIICSKSSLTDMIRMEPVNAGIDASRIICLDLVLRKHKNENQLKALIESSIFVAGLNCPFY